MGQARSSIQKTLKKVHKSYPTSRPPPSLMTPGAGYDQHEMPQGPVDLSKYRRYKEDPTERFLPKDIDPVEASQPKAAPGYVVEERDEILHEMLMKLQDTIRVSKYQEAHKPSHQDIVSGTANSPIDPSIIPEPPRAPEDPRGIMPESRLDEPEEERREKRKLPSKLLSKASAAEEEGPPRERQEDGYLSRMELGEMFAVRRSDPQIWTDKALAKRFGVRPKEVKLCFQYFQTPTIISKGTEDPHFLWNASLDEQAVQKTMAFQIPADTSQSVAEMQAKAHQTGHDKAEKERNIPVGHEELSQIPMGMKIPVELIQGDDSHELR